MDAEVAAAVERLVDERLAAKDVVKLTGLDQRTVRRVRQLETNISANADDVAESADWAAGVRVA